MWDRGGCLSLCFVWVWSSGDTQTYVPGLFFLGPFSSLNLRAIGLSETSLKKHGCHGLGTSLRGTKVLSKACVHRDHIGFGPIVYTVLLLSDTQTHIHTPHSAESSGWVIGLSQRSLLGNIQSLQQTRSHAPSGIRTRNPRTRAAFGISVLICVYENVLSSGILRNVHW